MGMVTKQIQYQCRCTSDAHNTSQTLKRHQWHHECQHFSVLWWLPAAQPSQQLLWAPNIKHSCKCRSGGNTLNSPNTQLRMLQRGREVQCSTGWKVREHCRDWDCPTHSAQGSWRGHSHNGPTAGAQNPREDKAPLSKPSQWTWASASIYVVIQFLVSHWQLREPRGAVGSLAQDSPSRCP